MLLTQPNTLSEQQCRELEAFKMHTREAKLYRRAKVILYRNGGYTPDEIEEHTDYSEREQRNWVRRYREEGVEGLYDRPRSGRPRGTCRRGHGRTAARCRTRTRSEADRAQRFWGGGHACRPGQPTATRDETHRRCPPGLVSPWRACRRTIPNATFGSGPRCCCFARRAIQRTRSPPSLM